MEEQFLSVKEVSQYFKIPQSTIYKLCERGKIPCAKIGKQLRFRKSTIDHWLSEKEAKLISHSYQPEIIQPPAPAKSKHILLIDDDTLVLKTLANLLRSHGYDVEPAASGEEALGKIDHLHFNLIITDIKMPGIDGIETLRRIREFNQSINRRAVPEVIITGYIDSRAESEAQDLGIRDYLYKPFTISDFIKTVREKIEVV